MSCQYADIVVSPGALSFEATEGWQYVTPSQYVMLKKAGRGKEAHWSATTEAGWLRASPTQGIVPGRVKVCCESKSLSPGMYAGAVVLESIVNINIPRIPVMLTVHPLSVPREDYQFPEEPEDVIEPSPAEIVVPDLEPVPDNIPKEPEISWWQRLVWAILRVLTFWRPS